MFGEILEPLLAFLAEGLPFAKVSRLAVVSKAWRRVSRNALKTAHQLNLSGFAESVTDVVVRLALVRVTSEDLKVVKLCSCHSISPGGTEDILQYICTHVMRRLEHLRAQPKKDRMQVMRLLEHLRAQPHKQPVQAMRRGELLRAQPHKT
jgi:hypothetical protein